VDKIPEGYTMWARQTIDSDIFFYKPDKWFKIWFYLISKVNHKDNRLFKRGSGLVTYGEIEERTKATKGQIDKLMRFLKKSEMATTRKSTRGMVITILNYDKYQDSKSYTVDTPVDLRSKPGRNPVDTINKNVKNINKENNKNIYSEVINYLNLKTNQNYKPTTKKTQALIKSRLAEKFTLDDFKKVIDIKCSQWLDDEKFSPYLRPETLFGPKFEGYLNQKEKSNGDKGKSLGHDNSFLRGIQELRDKGELD